MSSSALSKSSCADIRLYSTAGCVNAVASGEAQPVVDLVAERRKVRQHPIKNGLSSNIKQFQKNLEEKLSNANFVSDIGPLLAQGYE